MASPSSASYPSVSELFEAARLAKLSARPLPLTDFTKPANQPVTTRPVRLTDFAKPASPPVSAGPPEPARSSDSSNLRFSLALVLVVILAGTVGWALSHRSTTTPAAAAAFRPSPASPPPSRRGWSSVAVARYGELTVYRRRSAQTRMFALANPTVTHAPLTLLVKQQRAGWVQAYLPVRPNGLLGWVHRRAIHLVTDPWALVVQLRSHRLVVRQAGRVIRVLPIAVGKPSTPTPTGRYFVNELLKQPDPAGAYGPYAFGTSAYSTVLLRFNGGTGQIGIHGTDQPWVIGTSATHGCIRLYNRDIVWLSRRVPLGTPLQIRG